MICCTTLNITNTPDLILRRFIGGVDVGMSIGMIHLFAPGLSGHMLCQSSLPETAAVISDIIAYI